MDALKDIQRMYEMEKTETPVVEDKKKIDILDTLINVQSMINDLMMIMSEKNEKNDTESVETVENVEDLEMTETIENKGESEDE